MDNINIEINQIPSYLKEKPLTERIPNKKQKKKIKIPPLKLENRNISMNLGQEFESSSNGNDKFTFRSNEDDFNEKIDSS